MNTKNFTHEHEETAQTVPPSNKCDGGRDTIGQVNLVKNEIITHTIAINTSTNFSPFCDKRIGYSPIGKIAFTIFQHRIGGHNEV